MNRRRMLALLGLVPAAAAAVPVLELAAARARPRRVRPARGFHRDYFPNVTLLTHDGERVRLYDDLLRDKTVLVSFFYAGGTDGVCPLVTRNLVRVQRLLGDRCGRDVFMHSFTLSPREDTPERMRRYREDHEVGPGWTFLTGRPGDLELCRVRFGFTDPDPGLDRTRSQHTNVVLLGNEPHERWLASPALAGPDRLLVQLNRVAGLQA